MKKAIIAAAIAAFAQTASAAIEGSPHDLSSTGPGVNGTQSSCMYCHNAHKTAGIAAAPLWNRTMSAQSFTQTDTKRTNAVINGGATLTCLSCHDGTIDLGTLLNNAPDVLGFIGANYQIGAAGTLNADHPVGLAYVAGGTASLRPIADSATNLSITTTKLATLECSGCHDPHNTVNTKFLRAAVGGICGECHVK